MELIIFRSLIWFDLIGFDLIWFDLIDWLTDWFIGGSIDRLIDSCKVIQILNFIATLIYMH